MDESEADRLARCFGKQKFPNYTAANRVINRAKRKYAVPYRCPHCGQWHIGHKEKARIR